MPREGYRRERDASASDRERDRDREHRRRRHERRRKHESGDSTAELLVETTRRRTGYYRESPGTSPVKTRHRPADDGDSERERERRRADRREDRRRERERDIDGRARSKDPETERYADRERRREERRRRERERDRGREDEEEEVVVEVRRQRRRDGSRRRLVDDSETSHPSTNRSGGLSIEGLAALDAMNQKLGVHRGETRVREEVDDRELRRREERRRRKEERRRRKENEDDTRGPDVYDEYLSRERREDIDNRGTRDARGRVVSGQKLERGRDSVYDEKTTKRTWWWQRTNGGGESSSGASYISPEEERRRKRRRKKLLIFLAIIALILAIAIPVGIVVSKKGSKSGGGGGSTTSDGKPTNSNLDGVDPSSVPANYKGTWIDPFSWYDTTDFNVTFTDTLVGGLPIMGLNASWDDSTRANSNVPPLNQPWSYGTMPVRGINLGGWLVLEPVITPSFFNSFKSAANVVDEWSLSSTLGNGSARSTIEPHYSSFISEQDFADMQAAGFDHVRIPFGYWTIIAYDGDPYISQVAWRYLLRAIEWARKYGLRVNLDLHGAPGSQNGWNHSGRQGDIGWLNGTDGTLNAKRTLDIHNQLSQFFAQDRYKNIIGFYGLLNEPRMTFLDTTAVLQWTTDAASIVRKNGINCTIVFGDGFMGLDNWQGKLRGVPNMLLDVHQYVIFNTQQLALNHAAKTTFACGGWTAQTKRSMDTATGFGPTIVAEWSQADTDCAPYLNNVGVGSRWQGTLNMVDTPGSGGANGSVLTPTCPTANNPRCTCDGANASPGGYSAAYKQWLLQFAVAQMQSFEYGWGWFYWTWKTEAATQWSYRDGLAAGILPQKTWQRDFDCAKGVPDYGAMGLPEYY